MKNNSYRTFN